MPEARLRSGDEVGVRYLALGPWEHLDLASNNPWGALFALSGFAVVWNAFMSLFHYGIWFIPWLEGWLVKHGELTPGVVIRKWETRGRGASKYLLVAYADDREIRRERKVTVTKQRPGRRRRSACR